MSPLPEHLKYAETHEWVFVDEQGIATVGITDFAQESLGDLMSVRLANLGSDVTQGEAIMSVESVKAASDIFAPISGEIIAINNTLEDDPENINDEPYDSGWLLKIMTHDIEELNNLMSAEDYCELIHC